MALTFTKVKVVIKAKSPDTVLSGYQVGTRQGKLLMRYLMKTAFLWSLISLGLPNYSVVAMVVHGFLGCQLTYSHAPGSPLRP